MKLNSTNLDWGTKNDKKKTPKNRPGIQKMVQRAQKLSGLKLLQLSQKISFVNPDLTKKLWFVN